VQAGRQRREHPLVSSDDPRTFVKESRRRIGRLPNSFCRENLAVSPQDWQVKGPGVAKLAGKTAVFLRELLARRYRLSCGDMRTRPNETCRAEQGYDLDGIQLSQAITGDGDRLCLP
jgi:hypothetical protein